jgi:hypothetical protein
MTELSKSIELHQGRLVIPATLRRLLPHQIQSLIFEMEKQEKMAFEIAPAIVGIALIMIIEFGVMQNNLSISIIITIFGLVLFKEILFGMFKFSIASQTQSAIFTYKKSLSLLKEAQLRQENMEDDL